ncbi:P-loop containing nucleoside triphosphate hydrolase protein [Daldinia vernicosa]|uniref:P-loop containing nucleoside triphosphate hydrolase protein n=1 Tax=Daldinia vernicosa TaxID=114800 RepID=UPI002007C3E4|nr:P-loop containing nucleoside triphosphate hydrolase protein [Daldinia vernicosa]KAI0847805.1 P-loop containing nucleoside triphosphate hydrolase protein [Daldinia vernicosa]
MARCSNKKDQYKYIYEVIDSFIAGNLQSSVPQNVHRAIISKSLYHIPHPRNELYGGRDRILDKIEEHFFVKERRKLAVLGLGGVGKTQVALEFAYRVQDRKDEYSVFWVLAQSQATFEQSYAGLARLLQISGEGDQKMLVKQHLSSENAGKWLLIVDNVDDYEATFRLDNPTGMIKYLPQNDNGLILFTTRSREVAMDVAMNDVVDLGEMNPEEAYCGHPRDVTGRRPRPINSNTSASSSIPCQWPNKGCD